MFSELEKNLETFLNRKGRKGKPEKKNEPQRIFDGILREFREYGFLGFDRKFFYNKLNEQTWRYRRKVLRLLKNSEELVRILDKNSYRNILYIFRDELKNAKEGEEEEKPARIEIKIKPTNNKRLLRLIRKKIIIYRIR